MIPSSTKLARLTRYPILTQTAIAALLVLAVLLPMGSPFVGEAEAYACNVYAYAPQDRGSYAFAQGEAYCPGSFEYKSLSVCLIKQDVGVVACQYDSGNRASYYAAASRCYGTGYYQTRVILTNQAARYSPFAFITC